MNLSRALCLVSVLLLSGCMIMDEGPESRHRKQWRDHDYAEPRYSPSHTPQVAPERDHDGRKYRTERNNGRDQEEYGRRTQRDESRKRKDAGPREHNTHEDKSRDRDNAGQRVQHDRQESDRKHPSRDNGQTRNSSGAAKETKKNRKIPPPDGEQEQLRKNGSR